MVIGPQKPPETILREALVVARDELKRVNDHYSCVRPDPFGVVIQALAAVPAIPDIKNAADDTERRIVGRLVRDLLAAGHALSVHDGEETVVTKCREEEIIFNALASTDCDTLYVHKADRSRSFVLLIWGNGRDIISDYGVSLEPVIAPISDWIEETFA